MFLVKDTCPKQRKGRIKKENITGLVEGGVELVEEAKKEEVLEVRVSSRSLVNHNTRKM